MSNCSQSGKYFGNVISGNSIDIKIAECTGAAEVRADVVVDSSTGGADGCRVIRLWGQVKDCNNQPVPNALLKLVKVVCTTEGVQYQGIAHTVSDCEGFYQFDLCYCDGDECYKVLVSRAYTGPEQVIVGGEYGNCNACSGEEVYNPCKQYDPIYTPATPCPPCPPTPPVPPCPPVPPRPCPPVPPRPCPPAPPRPPYGYHPGYSPCKCN